MSDGGIDEAAVREVLDQFPDPETGRSITQLEQVRPLELSDKRLSLELALTTHSAPIWEETRAELIRQLRQRFPQLDQVDVELTVQSRAAEPLGEIGLTAKSVIAVGSGKGGVGKSTIAACLAIGLKNAGCEVGLMDADVYGPSIPHLLGVNQRPEVHEKRIAPIMAGGLKVMSMGFLVPEGEAVIWRGPMLHGAIQQFLRDTLWGDLDYLVIDLPPGTGDIVLTLSQLLPLAGAVVVCTPQDVALLDATKAIAMFRKVNINVLGMVENMSHFICTQCSARHDIFGTGGARRRAEELEVPFLGEVPINLQIRSRGDEGKLAALLEDEIVADCLAELSVNLVRNLAQSRRDEPQLPPLSIV